LRGTSYTPIDTVEFGGKTPAPQAVAGPGDVSHNLGRIRRMKTNGRNVALENPGGQSENFEAIPFSEKLLQ